MALSITSLGEGLSILSPYKISYTYDGFPALIFDTIETTSVVGRAETTSYPIEAGFSVIDYKYSVPGTITVKGVISRSSGGLPIVGDLGLDITGRISDTDSELESLKNNLYLVDIRTKTGIYRSYTLTSYETNESLDNYSLYEVTMEFQYVDTTAGSLLNPANIADSDTINSGVSFIEEYAPNLALMSFNLLGAI